MAFCTEGRVLSVVMYYLFSAACKYIVSKSFPESPKKLINF